MKYIKVLKDTWPFYVCKSIFIGKLVYNGDYVLISNRKMFLPVLGKYYRNSVGFSYIEKIRPILKDTYETTINKLPNK